MGYLESLAGGLRQAGGVLSPSVSSELAKEDQQDALLKRQAQLQLMAQALKDQQEKALSGVVAPFLDKGDLEGAAAAAAKSGAPGATALALKLTDAAESRKQRAFAVTQTMLQREDALAQARELALQRATDQKERDRINQDFKDRQLAMQEQWKSQDAEFKKMNIDLAQMRLDQQNQQQTSQKVRQLGNDLNKANLPEADAVLGQVEDALKANPQIANYISGPGKLAPDFAVPNDIVAGRQAFQKLFNITLKNRSGAAVTVPEFERLKAEFGNGVFKTPQMLANAVEQARNIINKHYAGIAGGYGKDVLNSYNENLRGVGGRVVLEPQTASAAPASPEDPLGIRK